MPTSTRAPLARQRREIARLQIECQFKQDRGSRYPFYYVCRHRLARGTINICEDCRAILILQHQAAFRRWCDGTDGDALCIPPEQIVIDEPSPTAIAVAELEARNAELYESPLLPEDERSLRQQIAAGILPQDEIDYSRQIERYRRSLGKGTRIGKLKA